MWRHSVYAGVYVSTPQEGFLWSRYPLLAISPTLPSIGRISLASAKTVAAVERLAKTDRRIASDRAQTYLSAHPKLPANFADAIRSNEIVVGMTMEQVVAAWGRPAEIQKFRDGRVQHWFFGCDWPHDCEFPRRFGARELFEDPNRKYQSQALFENGVVVKWWS